MLPRSQRISAEQFKAVMEKGRVNHSSIFLLRSLTDKSFDHARVGAAVPVKIAKKAVVRNKTRRRMYAAIRAIYDRLRNDVNAVVFAKQAAIEAEKALLEKEMEQIFVKAGLLK